MSVIAVFCGAYSSAGEIVERVAGRLGYTVVGDELLVEAAREFGTSAEKLARALNGVQSFFNPLTREWEKSLVYVKAALAGMLRTDEQIYYGPATHLVPREITHVLRVGLIADHDYRVARAREEEQIGAVEAAARVKKNDEELADWTRLVLGSAPWDPDLYDALIPIPDTSIEQAVDVICDGVAREALRPTRGSIQATVDFQLATRVNVTLLEHGIKNCEVKADGDRVTVVVNQSPSPGKLGRTVKALRFDKDEEQIHAICAGIEGVEHVDVRPGVGMGQRTRTLLVDDEQEYVMTLSERLEVRDIPSDVVYDGQQALSFVESDVPDVMVLDLRMPGMDGMEVLRRIKKEHPYVQVIIVTGHGSEKDENEARQLGAFDFLHKPVDINLLAEKIKAAEQAARAARAARGDA